MGGSLVESIEDIEIYYYLGPERWVYDAKGERVSVLSSKVALKRRMRFLRSK